MASTNPRIRTLERLVQELERAPLLHKPAIASLVAKETLELFAEVDARLTKLEFSPERRRAILEHQAAAPVPPPTDGPVR